MFCGRSNFITLISTFKGWLNQGFKSLYHCKEGPYIVLHPRGSVRSEWWYQELSFQSTFFQRACFFLLNLLNSSSLWSLKIFSLLLYRFKNDTILSVTVMRKIPGGPGVNTRRLLCLNSLEAYYSYVSLTHPHRQQLIA